MFHLKSSVSLLKLQAETMLLIIGREWRTCILLPIWKREYTMYWIIRICYRNGILQWRKRPIWLEWMSFIWELIWITICKLLLLNISGIRDLIMPNNCCWELISPLLRLQRWQALNRMPSSSRRLRHVIKALLWHGERAKALLNNINHQRNIILSDKK